MTIQDEKRRQALLTPGELWLIAARESKERPEPALTLVAGVDVTWDSLFLLTREETVAIVGRFDADAVPAGRSAPTTPTCRPPCAPRSAACRSGGPC